jgi:ubiquinone/menaquinone biosynthesis C-methylase UbiE
LAALIFRLHPPCPWASASDQAKAIASQSDKLMSTLHDFQQQETRRMREWEQRVEAMVRAKGGTVSAKEFQRIVNVVFHDVEAASYDKLHREMWESLEIVFDQLASDVLANRSSDHQLTLADVGCGTGLATEFLLKSALGPRIDGLAMIDTSEEMLSRCRGRSAGWSVKPKFVRGQLDAVPDGAADMLVASSLLHHLTDLIGFCRDVERVLRPGGFFVHIQDPLRGSESNENYLSRRATYDAWLAARRRSVARLPLKCWKWLNRKFSAVVKRGYLHEVNKRLIGQGVIRRPLTPREIWSITDLREKDLPISAVDGISPEELRSALPGFHNVGVYTYSFFGTMSSHLPAHLADEEKRLFETQSPDGIRLAGVWQRV